MEPRCARVLRYDDSSTPATKHPGVQDEAQAFGFQGPTVVVRHESLRLRVNRTNTLKIIRTVHARYITNTRFVGFASLDGRAGERNSLQGEAQNRAVVQL